MGTTQAMGMAEAVSDGDLSLRQALGWHLSANFYPPIDPAYVDVAVEVIETLANDTGNPTIVLPESRMLPRQARYIDEQWQCDAWDLVDILHLDPFLEASQ